MLNWRRPFGDRRRVVAPEIKDSRVGGLIALTSGGRAQWTPRDYANLAAEGFGKNAIAYRCVRMIAEAAASAPLAVFADGERRDDHPLRRLLDRPNPEQRSETARRTSCGCCGPTGCVWSRGPPAGRTPMNIRSAGGRRGSAGRPRAGCPSCI